MIQEFVHSDEGGCWFCKHMLYDIDRGNYCSKHSLPVKPYNMCNDWSR